MARDIATKACGQAAPGSLVWHRGRHRGGPCELAFYPKCAPPLTESLTCSSDTTPACRGHRWRPHTVCARARRVRDVGNQDMLTASLKAVVDKYSLRGLRLGDVVAGAVMKHSSQWNLTRESLLDSGLSPETPGLDVQRACGTSIEAAIIVANKIALGQIDAGIAGGVDTISDPPIVFGKEYQQLHAARLPRAQLR